LVRASHCFRTAESTANCFACRRRWMAPSLFWHLSRRRAECAWKWRRR
jgi:hypothetical protein